MCQRWLSDTGFTVLLDCRGWSWQEIQSSKHVLELIYYSRTSLSRTRLFRITAYLEVKIWSQFYHEIMTTEQNNVEKRSNFSSFPHYFIYTVYIFLISNYIFIC